MTFEEFEKSIKKVNSKRKNTIKNSFGTYDIYKYMRKNKWYNIGSPVSESDFYKIIRTMNTLLVEELLKTGLIKFPHQMGKLYITNEKKIVSFYSKGVFINRPVDWKRTLQLWYEDEDAKNNKTLIREDRENYHRILYSKQGSRYKNMFYYKFLVSRTVKYALKDLIDKGELTAVIYNNI